jgi:hypothetical protein
MSVSELEMGENVLGDRRLCELPMRKTTESETETRSSRRVQVVGFCTSGQVQGRGQGTLWWTSFGRQGVVGRWRGSRI